MFFDLDVSGEYLWKRTLGRIDILVIFVPSGTSLAARLIWVKLENFESISCDYCVSIILSTWRDLLLPMQSVVQWKFFPIWSMSIVLSMPIFFQKSPSKVFRWQGRIWHIDFAWIRSNQAFAWIRSNQIKPSHELDRIKSSLRKGKGIKCPKNCPKMQSRADVFDRSRKSITEQRRRIRYKLLYIAVAIRSYFYIILTLLMNVIICALRSVSSAKCSDWHRGLDRLKIVK